MAQKWQFQRDVIIEHPLIGNAKSFFTTKSMASARFPTQVGKALFSFNKNWSYNYLYLNSKTLSKLLPLPYFHK